MSKGRIPPFVAGLDHAPGDTLSRDGAERVAATIRRAWRSVGHDIECKVELSIFADSVLTHPSAHYVVRSHLVAGLPRSASA